MKTLYDLLGARSDDDAEALRAAFRKAAKANHPDLHGGDPEAARRFTLIAEAYDILRDEERRASYDRLLQFERKQRGYKERRTTYERRPQFEREQRGSKLRRTASYLMRGIVSDAIVGVALAVVLVGGVMVGHMPQMPSEQHAGAAVRASADIAAIKPSPTNAKSDELDGLEPAGGGGAQAAIAGGAPALNTGAAKVTNAVAVTMGHAGSNSMAEDPVQYLGTAMPDRDNAQLVKVLSSSAEQDLGVGMASASDLAMADDERDAKGRPPRDIKADGLKISDTKLREPKTPPRARTAAKRQTASRSAFEPASEQASEQASLENKNTCSGPQSCSRDLPAVFGVGF